MKNNKFISAQMSYPILQKNVCEDVSQRVHFSPGHDQRLKLVWSFVNPELSKNKINEDELATIAARVRKKERKLIGQELHDNVNQILSTVSLFANMLRPADERDTEIRQKTIEYVAMAIEEIRKISWELVKPKQEEKGLIDSIRQVIDDIHFSTAIKIVFTHSMSIETLEQDKKITLLRIVQEQLKNVINYSKASMVNIKLRLRDGEATLFIKDNGVGFDPKLCHQGIGLSNIHERAQSHNGVVNLQSGKGSGCSLTVCLPG